MLRYLLAAPRGFFERPFGLFLSYVLAARLFCHEHRIAHARSHDDNASVHDICIPVCTLRLITFS